MSIMVRRSAAVALSISAWSLIALAGCSSAVTSDSAKPAAAATPAPTPASAPAPKPAEETATDAPGSYAVIDGKHAPIPDTAMGAPATVARIMDEGRNRNHVMDQITYISNSIGPRLTGSSNAEKEIGRASCRERV